MRSSTDPAAIGLAAIALADLAIVIPTLNPGLHAVDLVEGLRGQGIDFDRVIVIDSGSDDGSIDVFRAAGCSVHVIERAAFDHGATRNLGLTLCRSAKFVLFLTQDAVPADVALARHILQPFEDPLVALVYGRQLAREGAGGIESHARQFNYPCDSATRTMATAGTIGIKAVFNSNSCAAYRRSALEGVGGFPVRIIMGEDQVAAARLLRAGWTVAYRADACVTHSHAYTVMQEFSRYFDIGVFHEQERTVLAPFGTAGAEGFRYVASELRYLLRTAPWRIPEAMLRSTAKLLGYRLGRRHRALPSAANRHLAMNGSFFLPPLGVAAAPTRAETARHHSLTEH